MAFLSRSPGLLNRRPGGPLCWVLAFSTASCHQRVWSSNSIGGPKAPSAACWLSLPHLVTNRSGLQNWSPNSPISKLTDFLSSLSYVIVQSPTQYLPIAGHQNVSLPPSLEWNVWSSSSGNNCHAVHRSLSSGASVCDCTVGFALLPSLEWHVWQGRRSIYNSSYVRQ